MTPDLIYKYKYIDFLRGLSLQSAMAEQVIIAISTNSMVTNG